MFKRVEPPIVHKKHTVNKWCEWYSWSDECRNLLINISNNIENLPTPELLGSDESKPYNKTFSITCQIKDMAIHNSISNMAESLYHLNVGDNLHFFTCMLDEKIQSKTIHYFLSYLQFYTENMYNKKTVVLYSPLGSISEKGFPFPLHLDLYLQKKLMIIFDNVPKDRSGKTLLLPVILFWKILDSLETMSDNRKDEIRNLIKKDQKEDKFTDFYNFLYQKNAIWKRELSQKMRSQRIEIKLNRGEGLLLHDRKWLHGRTSPSNGVPSDRLYRLAFNTLEDN